MKKQIILGVDPGTAVSGFGLIEVQDGRYSPIDYGCIRPPQRYPLSDRYLIIFQSISEIIDRYRPDAVVVETQYVDRVHRNVQSAIKLGMARGVILVAARNRGIAVFEYPPSRAKLAVVGTGRASKHQVQAMISKLLNLAEPPQPEDAADALALAICHAHTPQFKHKII